MRLTATGNKNGKPLTVEYDGEWFLFNGKENLKYEAEIELELEQQHLRGGTFQPEKDSNLNLINVIEAYFFDRCVIADVEDANIEEMESVPGRIY